MPRAHPTRWQDAPDVEVMRKGKRAPAGSREESLKGESFFSKILHARVSVKTLLTCTILLCGAKFHPGRRMAAFQLAENGGSSTRKTR